MPSESSRCIDNTEGFRNDLHQILYAYVADVVGVSGKPELTEEELVDELAHEWAPARQALDEMSAVELTSTWVGLFKSEIST
ncbi:hypothetical protein F4860DRAFT_513761 [Xylaria cubensis]|nr:hypothetical protein F4860DRAFT_513761 [Xylaria cubensis]